MVPDLKLNCSKRSSSKGLLVVWPAWNTGRGVEARTMQDTCVHDSRQHSFSGAQCGVVDSSLCCGDSNSDNTIIQVQGSVCAVWLQNQGSAHQYFRQFFSTPAAAGATYQQPSCTGHHIPGRVIGPGALCHQPQHPGMQGHGTDVGQERGPAQTSSRHKRAGQLRHAGTHATQRHRARWLKSRCGADGMARLCVTRAAMRHSTSGLTFWMKKLILVV